MRPDTKLAGLTLLGRLLRQLEQAGYDLATVETGDARIDVERVLDEVPDGLSVEVRERGASRRRARARSGRAGRAGPSGSVGSVGSSGGEIRLRGAALYETGSLERALVEAGRVGSARVEPWCEPRDQDDLAEASRRIWGEAGKSVAHDGLVAYYVGRPLGRLFSRALVWTPVTPNQVTVASMLIGVAGAALAALGGRWWLTAGAFLYWFGMVVDCVDGDLARVRIEGSRAGQWLDTIADDVSTAAITLGFGLGLYRQTSSPVWAWAGLAGAICVALSAAHVYRGLIRYDLPIDTAKYPWFFLGEQGVVFEEESGSKWGLLAFAVRRDFSSAVYVVVSGAGLPWVAFVFMALGAVVAAGLAAVDFIVKTKKTRRQE